MNNTVSSLTETKRPITAPDLTRRPPRSPRVQLGGFALLPRCLDKGRATVAGTNGEYHFACPLDQQFLQFVGIDPEPLRQQLAAGNADHEILAWVQQHATHRRTAAEIAAWNAAQAERGPADADSSAYFAQLKSQVAPNRDDIHSWFELLDVDDHVSFGGHS